MTGATCGAGTAYPFGAPAFSPGFWWGSCYYILSFLCNVLQIFVRPFLLFPLAIVFSVLTVPYYPFGIFKLFLRKKIIQELKCNCNYHVRQHFSVPLRIEIYRELGLWCLMPLSTIFQLYRSYIYMKIEIHYWSNEGPVVLSSEGTKLYKCYRQAKKTPLQQEKSKENHSGNQRSQFKQQKKQWTKRQKHHSNYQMSKTVSWASSQ